MSFSQHLAAFTPDGDTVLTVGVFDGVHLGHRHLLNHLIDWASPGCAPHRAYLLQPAGHRVPPRHIPQLPYHAGAET